MCLCRVEEVGELARGRERSWSEGMLLGNAGQVAELEPEDREKKGQATVGSLGDPPEGAGKLERP